MSRLAAAFFAATATYAVGINVEDLDLPIFCRVIEVGLQEAVHNPLVEDLNISTVAHIPLVGGLELAVSHMTIESVATEACSVTIDDAGLFRVSLKGLSMDLEELQWSYSKQRWPYLDDQGSASARTSLDLEVAIDMKQENHHFVSLDLDSLEVQLRAKKHPWFSTAISKVTNFMSGVIRKVAKFAVQKTVDEVLDTIYKDGACAFFTGTLKDLHFIDFTFTSYEPMQVDVPVLGMVEVSANSTSISPPKSMKCKKLAFDGTTLAANIQEVAFDTTFVWAYEKPGSDFFQNQGTGAAAVVAGTELEIDVMKPSATKIDVSLPELSIKLHSDSLPWMYSALTSVLSPLMKSSLQLFGGKVLAHYIQKCLEDPLCPKVHSMPEVLYAPGSSTIGQTTKEPEVQILV